MSSTIREFRYNFYPTKICFIQSVLSDEIGMTDKVVAEAQAASARRGSISVTRYCVNDRSELEAALTKFATNMSQEDWPLLQLDMHGNAEQGVKLANGSSVNWIDLSKMLSLVNLTCGNRLAVISCCCFSFKIINPPDYAIPSPFQFIAAPASTVTLGFLNDRLSTFYIELIDRTDIESALKALTPYFSFHFPEYVLFFALKDEIVKFKGRKGAAAREEAITELIRNRGVSESNISSLRKSLKNFHKKFCDQDLASLLAVFFCGRGPSFTVEMLKEEFIRPQAFNE